jgi:hypothetical protein
MHLNAYLQIWNVKALSTAEDYDLEGLMEGLIKQNLYVPMEIQSSNKCRYIQQVK